MNLMDRPQTANIDTTPPQNSDASLTSIGENFRHQALLEDRSGLLANERHGPIKTHLQRTAEAIAKAAELSQESAELSRQIEVGHSKVLRLGNALCEKVCEANYFTIHSVVRHPEDRDQELIELLSAMGKYNGRWATASGRVDTSNFSQVRGVRAVKFSDELIRAALVEETARVAGLALKQIQPEIESLAAELRAAIEDAQMDPLKVSQRLAAWNEGAYGGFPAEAALSEKQLADLLAPSAPKARK
jgi:hypothetical protein